MIKFGEILCLLILWIFSTMTKVNESSNSFPAFIWKSIFFWAAIVIAYSLGGMH